MSGSNNVSVNSTSESPPHVFQLCKDQLVALAFYTVVDIITFVFGFPACVAVLWQLFQKLRRGTAATSNDVFMMNLTVMDLVFVGSNLPEILFLWYNLPLQIFSGFIYAFTMTGRPLIMTCICLDCYLAVVHPITYRARKSLMTPRVLMCVGVWAITLAYGCLYATFYDIMIEHPAGILPYILAILTIGICDFFILRALRSSDPGGQDLHPQKKKALQTVINSLVTTVMAYLPRLLLFILFCSISMSDELLCILHVVSQTTVIAGSVVMPILYLNNLGKLDRIWLCCHRRT